MKCLIIDASKSFRLMLSHLVEERCFEAELVSTGTEGIKKLEEAPFDLVFVSMYLDDMDGMTFASHLRSCKKTCRIPLVMITSSEEKNELDRAVSVGVTEVFSKKQFDKIDEFVFQFVMRHGFSDGLLGRVLYVEDSKAIAMKTKALLEDQGLDVDHFTSAEQALEAFSLNNYDLVLTDVVLEGQMSGYGLLRELRNLDGKKQRIPVLAMSGFNDDVRKIEMLLAGANDYVPKPALDEELIARVKNQIMCKKQMDIIEMQSQRMQEMAMKDQLTDLYNRHFLMEVVPARISEAKRHETPLSMMIIDADKFKHVNDTHGHAVGDSVLKEIATILRKNCRGEDVAARFGGEEFIVLLVNCDEVNAASKAEQLRKKIESAKPGGLNITASFGISEYIPGVTNDFNDMFLAADKAVYAAKDTGRNKVVRASSLLSTTEGPKLIVS